MLRENNTISSQYLSILILQHCVSVWVSPFCPKEDDVPDTNKVCIDRSGYDFIGEKATETRAVSQDWWLGDRYRKLADYRFIHSSMTTRYTRNFRSDGKVPLVARRCERSSLMFEWRFGFFSQRKESSEVIQFHMVWRKQNTCMGLYIGSEEFEFLDSTKGEMKHN